MKSPFPMKLAAISLLLFAAQISQAQQYRNIRNDRFNTVSSGPMGALVVDVAPNATQQQTDKAIADQVRLARQSRATGIQHEIDFLRNQFPWKGKMTAGFGDVVYTRKSGRLVIPTDKVKTRGSDISFVFPISTVANDGGWTQAQQSELVAIKNIMYVALKSVYGDPSWSGSVTVVNDDNTANILSDPNAISGGFYDVAGKNIHFAVYNSTQSKVLGLTQMMAFAFHGPASISYEAWERGMARAATLESVRAALPQLNATFGNGSVDPADPLWSSLDRYEILNQPALGNDRFFPISKLNGVANTNTFPNMIIPRLSMSGSAWLKCSAESPTFFSNFNQAYYAAFALDATTQNSIPKLRGFAQQALGGNIEGESFTTWYPKQFVLDTSVSPGAKLYVQASALRPDTGMDDFAIAVVIFYYQTTFDNNSNADEANLNGTCFPVYWDYTFGNRLFLAAQYERIDIRDGIGTVAPTFFNNIGGDPTLNGQMRIAMDFPVNSENARIYVAPRSSGNVTTPNNFWGAVVGMDTGKVRIQTDSGTDVTVNIAQGAFGSVLNPTPFTRPGRATLTITNSSNVQILQRNVNYGYNEYVPVLYATDPIKSLTHTFPAGPAMISFPLQPLQPKAADALLDPVSGLPIFNDGNLLLAEWRQNQNKADGDNYLRYPVMDVLKPGRGYWENFAAATPVTVTGRVANVDQAVSTALLHGWNQIGSPYDAPVAVTDLLFQYLADNVPVDIATAITRGYIVAQNIPGSGLVTVFDFSPATGYTPATSLAPWKGYWIRVLVSEGVTITYPNPTGRSAHLTNRTSSRAADPPKGWSAALVVRSENGMASTAIIGQADGATAGYNSNLDAQRPPEFTRSVPIVSFNHADWGSNSGNYFSEIHSTGSATPWTVTVSVPDPAKQYTLSLGAITTIPIGTRLILEDTASGQKQYLLSSSGYRFTGGAATRAFKITVETRSYNSLRITSFNSRISRASGVVQMSYNLTEAALVSAEIRGADGRVIRRLASSRSANIGDNSIAWDGRDEKSTSVPSGSYLVHLTARTPEGDQARTIQTVTIVR